MKPINQSIGQSIHLHLQGEDTSSGVPDTRAGADSNRVRGGLALLEVDSHGVGSAEHEAVEADVMDQHTAQRRCVI